jgi:EmrB/QacA subfamily drug resistance transporter
MESMPLEVAPRQHQAGLDLPRRAKMEILLAVLLALFLGALDQTVVGTALPKIVTQLGGSEFYTWVVTIYLVTSTITVPFYGKLSDLYGRRPFLMIGIVIFLTGSVLSGLSQTMWQLILFRGIQGIGAGALFPIALAVIGDLFTPAERGKYQGLFGAVFGISFLIGPALGGFLTDVISWHYVFFVNLPVGLVSLYVIWHLLPTIKREGASRELDILGAAVFAVAIGFFLVGLTNKQSGDWGDLNVGGFVAIGLALGGLFVLIESRVKEPIVPLDLWRIRAYTTSMLATFFVSFGFFSAVIFLPRWFQVVRGSGATESGYQMFPLLIGLMGSSIISGQIIARTGRYKVLMIVSTALIGFGIWLMTGLTADTDLTTLWVQMFIAGVGIGPTLAAFTIIVQNAVPFSKLGVATSNLTFFRQIGGSVGLALAGTLFETNLKDILPTKLTPVFNQISANVPAQYQSQFAALTGGGAPAVDLGSVSGVGQSFGTAVLKAAEANAPAQAQPLVEQLIGPFVPQLDHAFLDAFATAIGHTFVIGIVTAAIALVALVLMPELALRTSHGPARAAHAPAPTEAGRPTVAEASAPAE